MTVLTLRDPAFLNVSSTVLWTPANITTALWLDAADASTITTVSGAVSQWSDKSGNERHAIQSTASSRPIEIAFALNNKSALRFDGVDDGLIVSSSFLQNTNSFSLFWIFARNGSGSGVDPYRPSISTYSLAGADGGGYHYVKNTNNFGASYPWFGNYNNYYDLGSGTQYANNSYELMLFRAIGSGFTVYRNANIEATVTASLSQAFVHNGLVIGRQQSPSRFSNIDINEVIVLPSTAGDLEVDKTLGYLAHKWGLTANLPSNHPYKLIPPTVNLSYDSDALAYITAVETADGQSLESEVKDAINKFVVGCKADGIWTAIKASCILAGARTLNGALVPLVGTAPTNNNFVSGDYNRKTGLVGNGSNKRLDSNRNSRSDPTNNAHLAVYATSITAATTSNLGLIGAGSASVSKEIIYNASTFVNVYLNSTGVMFNIPGQSTAGFKGATRSSSSEFIVRSAGSNYNSTSWGSKAGSMIGSTPDNENVFIFARGGGGSYTDARLAFYSIGESLDLAKLDSRVTTLINAFGTAIA